MNLKTGLFHAGFIVSLSFLTALAPPAMAQAAATLFHADTEGWTVPGDPESPIPLYMPTGGNLSGFIRTKDRLTGISMFWNAPPTFLGSVRATYGSALWF